MIWQPGDAKRIVINYRAGERQFLVSPEPGFITGQVLTLDGGRMDYIGHP